MKLLATSVLLSLLIVPVAGAEEGHGVPRDSALYREVAALDAAVFDAFNRCELEKLGPYFSDDLEFYHDNDGLSRGRKAFLEAVQNNICGKMTRELLPDTLEVYPLKGFGALEIGVHRFHHPGREVIDGVGEGRFVHIWRRLDGVWQVTRVMSFDHHTVSR